MPKIKETLGQEKEIWVDVNEDNYRAFFRQAKKEGFVWINGKEIQPNKELFHFCISLPAFVVSFSVGPRCLASVAEPRHLGIPVRTELSSNPKIKSLW